MSTYERVLSPYFEPYATCQPERVDALIEAIIDVKASMSTYGVSIGGAVGATIEFGASFGGVEYSGRGSITEVRIMPSHMEYTLKANIHNIKNTTKEKALMDSLAKNAMWAVGGNDE